MSVMRTPNTLRLQDACSEAAGRLNAALLLLKALENERAAPPRRRPEATDTRGFGMDIAEDIIADVRDLLLRAYREADEGRE